jgi:hypothetical protein
VTEQQLSSGQEEEIYRFSKVTTSMLGAHQAAYLMDSGALSPDKNRLGCEVFHSPLSKAVIENKWSYTSTPPYKSMAVTEPT